jgi:archaellum component FlaC
VPDNVLNKSLLDRRKFYMSEDQTNISGNDEPTEELEAQKAATTNPMLEVILAKINAIGEELGSFRGELSSFRSEVNTRFDALEKRMDTIEKRMYTIERKFDVFSIELISVKAGVLDAQNRLDELERKAS